MGSNKLRLCWYRNQCDCDITIEIELIASPEIRVIDPTPVGGELNVIVQRYTVSLTITTNNLIMPSLITCMISISIHHGKIIIS